MTCPRCGHKMKILAHRPHKKEKWVCPSCRKVRMKSQKKKSDRGRGARKGDWD